MKQPLPILALIDDDPIFHFTTSRFLKVLKHEATMQSYHNGQSALQYLVDHLQKPEELPDIILLDINMPVMDGWMFLEAFEEHARQLSKPVTIYMVSSSIAPEDKRKARSNPLIKDYLIKPLDPEKIGELLIGMHAQ